MIIVDASVLVEFLLRTSGADAIERIVFDSRDDLAAPHLIDVEVLNAIRRSRLRKVISAEGSQATIGALADLPTQRYQRAAISFAFRSYRSVVASYLHDDVRSRKNDSRFLLADRSCIRAERQYMQDKRAINGDV